VDFSRSIGKFIFCEKCAGLSEGSLLMSSLHLHREETRYTVHVHVSLLSWHPFDFVYVEFHSSPQHDIFIISSINFKLSENFSTFLKLKPQVLNIYSQLWRFKNSMHGQSLKEISSCVKYYVLSKQIFTCRIQYTCNDKKCTQNYPLIKNRTQHSLFFYSDVSFVICGILLSDHRSYIHSVRCVQH
jgi:hypothetical protein